MSDEQLDEHSGLLDNDPALDYILYSEMEKEERQPQKNGGCMSLVLFLSVPFSGMYLLMMLDHIA